MEKREIRQPVSGKKEFSRNILVLFILVFAIALYILFKVYGLDYFGSSGTVLNSYIKIVENAVIILAVFLLAYLFIKNTKKLIGNHLEKVGRSKKNIKLFLNVYESFVWIVVIFLTFSLIFKQVGSLLTSVGLIGFGLTLALQKPILNFVGWVTIIFGKTYHIGDVISINNIMGKVYDIRVMYTNIGELNSDWDSTGKAISIPNEFVFTYPLINFSKGSNYIWDDITIHLTYHSNWKKAMTIVEKAIQDYYDKKIKRDVKKKFDSYINFKDYEKITIRFGMHEKGLYIKARYMVDFSKANEVKKEITKILLDKLKTKDIFLGKTENVA